MIRDFHLEARYNSSFLISGTQSNNSWEGMGGEGYQL